MVSYTAFKSSVAEVGGDSDGTDSTWLSAKQQSIGTRNTWDGTIPIL